jgi:hypothetical protein
VLVVWKLDRLSRSLRDVLTIMERLTESQSGLSQPDRSDRHDDAGGTDDDADGRGLCGIRKGHVAGATKAGLDSARREGRIGGRRPKLSPQQQSEIRRMVAKGTKPRLMLPGYSESTQPPSVGSSHGLTPNSAQSFTPLNLQSDNYAGFRLVCHTNNYPELALEGGIPWQVACICCLDALLSHVPPKTIPPRIPSALSNLPPTHHDRPSAKPRSETGPVLP